jgi:hypothetical protein
MISEALHLLGAKDPQLVDLLQSQTVADLIVTQSRVI